ncbi:serine/threonine-protein phosphatase [Gregarina niphandrodes]|uniref:Serine/threonine-protein phosphatase n=1 Tax=Gregarina niphandrodes TaxID=110365 RepID=A0A023B873_GRENI|nr:serine/threonine-protein phosphatase [Gregarina niphandrodes]EZG68220.1 serine/threonine-protein phosphatase [Gregarina niphandrodes]|eukprot:XP_011130022.1 serine/threonine-protein phosphatase [Gregarina niphandrodes]
MEALPDPLHDRAVADVEAPPVKPLPDSYLFENGLDKTPNWQLLQDHFLRQGQVSKETCLHIIRRVSAITSCEPNLLRLEDPITVVGDIHGQFYDMAKLLEVGGAPEEDTQYLFLGDYVDRGSFAVEVVITLFCLKLAYPTRIWLLRGNHECRQMTAFFNFRDECEHKFDLAVYTAFMDAFDTLPLAALINNRFFAVHGGLSPQLRKKDSINGINRFQEPPRSGPFCDLLWADPVDEEKVAHQQHLNDLFFPNDVRGCSYFFGYHAAKTFLDDNKLLSIVRAHEAQVDGYKMHRAHPVNHFPTVITIFSAPNYCDVYNNKAAVLKFDNNTLNIQQFNFTTHPYHLPNFMDIFQWSIPFVSMKLNEILSIIMTKHAVDPAMIDHQLDEEDDSEDEDTGASPDLEAVLTLDDAAIYDALKPVKRVIGIQRANVLKAKVVVLARVVRMLNIARECKQDIAVLKTLNDGTLPPGTLLSGSQGIKMEIRRLKGPPM